MNLERCRIVQLPKIADPRGNLTFIEGGTHAPFSIARVYYLYDVPGGSERGGHALKTCEKFLIAMSGSFDVKLTDGIQRQTYHLNRAYYGLYIPPLVWREIDNFSSGAVCMALASEHFDEKGYVRDFLEYRKLVAEART